MKRTRTQRAYVKALDLVKKGASITSACDTAGISVGTYYRKTATPTTTVTGYDFSAVTNHKAPSFVIITTPDNFAQVMAELR